MRLLRTVLLHSLVWLTAVATVAAGTPLVQCRCPLAAKVCDEPAVVSEACCCCGKSVREQNPTPSCCHQTPSPKDKGDGPEFRHESCQRILVQPADATAQRTENDHQKIVANVVALTMPVGDGASLQTVSAGVNDSSRPPPVDLQLVLQHFLI